MSHEYPTAGDYDRCYCSSNGECPYCVKQQDLDEDSED